MSGPDRTRLVVLFGGQSAEHDVSRVTARHVLTAADPDRYDLVAIGITSEGTWVQCSTDVATFGDAMEISGDTVNPFSVLTSGSVVFPLLHGPMGEDGTLQGLLELAGVPFVGSAVLGSSMSMDKIIAKHVADAEGIAQTKWRGMHANELTGPASEALLDELAAELSGDALGEQAAGRECATAGAAGGLEDRGVDAGLLEPVGADEAGEPGADNGNTGVGGRDFAVIATAGR